MISYTTAQYRYVSSSVYVIDIAWQSVPCGFSLHVTNLYIGLLVTEVNCEADCFLERHWILFPAFSRSGCVMRLSHVYVGRQIDTYS